jgi:type IV secretion system protein VirB3
MLDHRPALTRDALFVGATRPPMRWGVTYSALLANLVFTLEVFLLTRNLFCLGLALPIHGLQSLLTSRDPRIFELLSLWFRTRVPAWFGNARHWRAVSYSALPLAPARLDGRRAVMLPPIL